MQKRNLDKNSGSKSVDDMPTAELPDAVEPRCIATARAGIRTGDNLNTFLSQLITDLAEGTMSPMRGTAVCNATGKFLKNIELHLKYGSRNPGPGMKMAELP